MGFEVLAKRNVIAHFGQRKTNMKFGGVVNDTKYRTVRWVFNYNDLPVGATHNADLSIPAGSTILSAKLRVLTAFTSTSTTTDLTIGLEQADGTDIDLDGLITAAQATQTTLAVVGSIIDGASGTPAELIGKTIGAAAGSLVVTPTVADLLTGRAELTVDLLLPAPAQQV